MVSPCTSPDSGPPYVILNLADIANVFVASSIQTVVSNALCGAHFRYSNTEYIIETFVRNISGLNVSNRFSIDIH